MKKYFSLLLCVLIIVSLLGGCSGQSGASESTQSTGTNQAASTAGSGETKTITFGVGAGDLTNELVAGFEKANPDIKVEVVTNETATREQVIKTGIAAGDPVDLAQYWGTRLNTFSDIGMCTDLKSYLDADDGAWRKDITEAVLKTSTGKNGEVWGIPISATYHVVFYNKTMMDKYGFKEPETWDEMTKIFETLKKDNIFGFTTNSVSMQDCMYGLTYSLLEEIKPGTAWSAANGDVSFVDTPESDAIKEVIEVVKGWYNKGYWYPGEGGINTSPDDSNAGFAQGRCMFIFNYSGALGIHEASCDFDIGVMLKPVKKAGMKSYENMETDVYFIPSNAPKKNIDSSIKFIKYMTSQEGQQIVADTRTVPATTLNLNISEGLKELVGYSATGNIIAGLNPCRMGSKMQSFIKQEVFSGPCSNTRSIDDTLKEMENLRLVIKSQTK